VEIERKFLVERLPSDLGRFPATRIRQGYLAVHEDGTEVRVRSSDGRAVLTVKQGAGRTRAEEELAIEPALLERLWPLTEGRRLEKTRYAIPCDDGATIELDVYEGELEGLAVAEVEFAGEREADEFRPPSWLGEEITDDARYRNQRLAQEGAPPTAV
jgi:adenylate cyclase